MFWVSGHSPLTYIPMDHQTILKKLGFSDKEINIYLTALKLGPAPVRRIAEVSGINRGTSYDILKSLIDRGLVSYYHKEKKQYFVAENPGRLKNFLENQISDLNQIKLDVSAIIPQLKSLYDLAGSKPVVKYYEGPKGIKAILEQVLEEPDSREYLVWSSQIRDKLYQAFAGFTKERIKRDINVRVISVGQSNEPVADLAERKLLSQSGEARTYIIIYADKSAFISLDSGQNLIGVVIEDQAINQTLKLFFNFIWKNL